MDEWNSGKICPRREPKWRKFGIHKREMTKISLKEYRELMEKFWKEFEE